MRRLNSGVTVSKVKVNKFPTTFIELVADAENYKILNDPETISNFNHKIPKGLAKKLKSGKMVTFHYAMNFMGHIWWDGSQFLNSIDQWQETVDLLKAPTLAEVVKLANDKYGYE